MPVEPPPSNFNRVRDDATVEFGSVKNCEISNLGFIALTAGAQTSGSAIHFVTGAINIVIADVLIADSYYGISATPPTATAQTTVNNVVLRNVLMDNIYKTGIYAQYAINWLVTDCIIGMHKPTSSTDPGINWPPGSNVYGIRMDTWTEGWIIRGVFVGGGEHCWRFNNTVNPSGISPREHRFYGCIGDEGGSSCFYATALRRSIFEGCWASSQSSTLSAAFVVDGAAVYGLIWNAGSMVNVQTSCFKFHPFQGFTISNSYFSSWGRAAANTYPAIEVWPNGGSQTASFFPIIGNTFFNDTIEFGGAFPWLGVRVLAGNYNKYVITNNVGGSLTSGVTVSDLGTTSTKLVVNPAVGAALNI